MVNGIYTGRNGMMLLQEMVDNTTNNLANATTTGFKKSLMSSIAEVNNKRNNENLLYHDESHWMADNRIDFEQGSLVDTGNPMDVAIEGKGFFQVETPDGVRYSRTGSLTRNGMGEVTTLQGFKVLDSSGSPIQAEGAAFSVSSNGNVQVDGQSVGKIAVVNFENPQELQRVGQNSYKLPEGSEQVALPSEDFTLRQGYIEASNVNVVESMVELIRFQRNYEMDQKAVQSEDETLQKAVNEIGRIG